jgi:glycosyltransferase involved in cell wall biosynthesis
VTRTPTISIVVPTYNRLERLRRVLAALADQTYPADDLEIIVVSDGATDGTDDYMRRVCQPNLTFLTQANAGPAVARNTGVAHARGRLVLFVDDDVIATPCLVARHVECHRREGPGTVVIGPMLTPPDFRMSPWTRWEQTMLYKQYAAMERGDYAPTSRQFYTGNASLGRAELTAAGGFDPRFRRAEDVELAYRLEAAGLKFSFDFEAIGYHYADRTFESWLRIASEYGTNDVVFACEGREWMLARLAEEYSYRNPLVRLVTGACLDHPKLRSPLLATFKAVAAAGERVGAERVTRFALSGIYHIAYYQGAAEQLGGPASFRRLRQLVRQAKAELRTEAA